MSRLKLFFNSIIWKIGATFLLILLVLSAVYLYIAVWTAEMYYQETMQKLGSQIAYQITRSHNLYNNNSIDEEALKQLFNEIMTINPSLEVYLLDNHGKILTYYAPNKEIKLKKVDLKPIEDFIDAGGKKFAMGNDPKNPGVHKAFSAAKVFSNNKKVGYLYIVMEGEEFKNAADFVFGSYMLRLALRSTTITLIAAALISFLALGFITRNLRKISIAIRKFKNGDLNARIENTSSGEIKEFADSFNDMADTIVQNMQDLKTMDNLRRDLVANVSHDLRTPLATIQGYIETIIIKKDSLSEEEKLQYLKTTLAGTERLKKLVNELFELSKLEAREKIPNPEPFHPAELANDIIQKNLLIAEANNIKLELDSPTDIPFVYADLGMIEKVIQNLLDNAIKFTPANGKVVLKLIPQDKFLEVNIIDSGKGIEKNELELIFDRYKRTDKVNSNIDGLGLGLAIVKKILEVHEIKIDVKSSINKGSVFSFGIPYYTGVKVEAEI